MAERELANSASVCVLIANRPSEESDYRFASRTLNTPPTGGLGMNSLS